MTFSINIDRYYKKRWYIFAVYSFLCILFLFLINDIIITDPTFFTGGNQKSVGLFRKVYKLIYVFFTLYALFKISTISLSIKYAVTFICDMDIPFQKLFTLVVLSEFTLLLPDLIEIIWFLFIKTNYTMYDVKFFNIFSIYSLFNSPEEVPVKYRYSLRVTNIFELMYCIVLYLGLRFLTKKTVLENIAIILSSYIFIIGVLITINILLR